MTATDLDLIRQFARDHSQDAFTTLVNRHVNFVYSAALRQIRSPQLAEEITQSVFADLARNAEKLSGAGFQPVNGTNSLTPWLYAVARRTAIDVIRKESRRQLREQIAVEMNVMNADEANWSEIEPLLDDALAALDETDRTAILLRYFENKNLREVGASLSLSDVAAQKRVSRAVDRLREFFSKRNVTIGASGLAVLISANAVQSAPVGLAATISTGVFAGTAVSAATVISATKTIAMTTFQKALITTALVVTIGAGIFEAHQATQLREQNQALRQQQTSFADQLRQLQQALDDATNRLANVIAENEQLQSNSNRLELLKLRGQVTLLQNTANDPTDTSAKAWLERVNKLKQRLEETPDAKIPELKLLSDQDWLGAASGKLDKDIDYRRALSTLRNSAEGQVAANLNAALQKYLADNNKQFPTDLQQLQPYFDSSMSDDILQRWEIVPASTISNFGFGDSLITEKNAVDDMFDTRTGIGANGYGSSDFLSTETTPILSPVYQAYAANNKQPFTDLSQLLPYATTPEQQMAVQKLIQRMQLNK